MELVIDANILFAALIKDSTTSDILFKHTLYAPEFILEEFRKYKDKLREKTKRTEESFNEFFAIMERNIIFVPKEELTAHIKDAEKISPDPKDVLYIALALKLHCSLWSQDKALKQQNVIKIYSTEELNKIFQ
jgi:predicted nucleic acid-binding protein